jgi:hypothetical protein
MGTINSKKFYENYYGHESYYLDYLLHILKLNKKSIIYLAGDSSLDNKHWLLDQKLEEAINGYEKILFPPIMIPDICYHLNKLLINTEYAVINTAVEEATLKEKMIQLNSSDELIINNITSNDILIISIGGNDIALKADMHTILNLMLLLSNYENGRSSILGMNYFINLFKGYTTNYINKLITKNIPKLIIICMIYYPLIKNVQSWANTMLDKLQYNTNYERIHNIISDIFKLAISEIKILKEPEGENVNIKYLPLYEVLDYNDEKDYVQRVEPSNKGGEKIAKAIVKMI